MKTVEASTIHEGIEQTTKLLSGLADQVADVHGKITGILHTESEFSGQAASSIRTFYKDIHAPLAVYLEGIVRDYHDTLRQIQQMLYELDRSEQAVIEEDYLQGDIKSYLKKTKQQTVELNDEVNHILRSVRDLIHLPYLSDDEVLHSVERAEKKVNKTIESVHQFDEEATHKLNPIKNDVNLLENYLHDIHSLTKNHQLIMTSYQANAIKQLDVHQQMIGGLMQKAIPKEFALDLFTSLASSSYLAMGNTLASIVRAGLHNTMSMTMHYRMRALATVIDTASPMSEDAFHSLDAIVVGSQSVRDYKGEYFGNYLTLQDGRIVRSFLNQDGVMKYHFVESIPEDRLKPVEEEKGLWKTIADGAAWTGEKAFQGGKAAADFLFLDDVKTLVDDEASLGEKALSGFFLLPIGKFGKAGKLVKDYDKMKVNNKGEILAKKKGSTAEGTGNFNDSYSGVKQASEYLKSQGVPRQFRKPTLESFEIGTIKLDVAGSNTYGLRFYDDINASAKGRYLFETFSPQVNRSNLALPPEWNRMKGVQQWKVKQGTIIIKGKAGPQLQMGNQYKGGVEQWYITNLEDLIKP